MNLHEAVKRRDAETVRSLLADGAVNDVNRLNHRGKSALHLAVDAGIRRQRPISPEIVKLLLEHGADPNIQNAEGSTPLLMLLEDKKSKRCCGEVMRLLLDHGADVAMEDEDGNNALLVASHRNVLSLDDYKALLEKCPVHIINLVGEGGEGENAMTLSIESVLAHNYPIEVINELIRKGADVNFISDGRSALEVLLEDFHHNKRKAIKILRILLQHGLNTDCILSDGNTALHNFLDDYGQNINDISLCTFVKEIVVSGASLCIPSEAESYIPLDMALISGEGNIDEGCPLLKLLVKHTLIQKFSEDYKEILHSEAHGCFNELAWLREFYDACVQEIVAMRSVTLGEGYTLYQFVATRGEGESHKKFVGEILQEIAHLHHPVYEDLIMSYLSKDDLLFYLQHSTFQLGTEHDVWLNENCSHRVILFLEKIDLMQLAFSCFTGLATSASGHLFHNHGLKRSNSSRKKSKLH